MPESLAIRLARSFQAELDQRQAAAVSELESAWRNVEAALTEQIVQLSTAMAQDYSGTEITPEQLFGVRRYVDLLAELQRYLAEFNFSAGVQIDTLQKLATQAGFSNAAEYISEIVRMYGPNDISLNFTRLGVGAANNIIAIARAGKPLHELLQRNYPATADGITRELIRSTAMGINPRETAQRIIENGLSNSLQHTLLVARDQQVRAWRQASLEQYKSSGLVEGYTRLAAKNARTCAACLALDGQFYTLDVPFSEHPQGRCTPVPAVKGLPRPTWQTGAEWFERQSISVQNTILGKQKAEAWRNGLFEFRNVGKTVPNAVWGPSEQVRSLEELLQ